MPYFYGLLALLWLGMRVIFCTLLFIGFCTLVERSNFLSTVVSLVLVCLGVGFMVSHCGWTGVN